MIASIPIIAFAVLALASAFLISKKGLSGKVKAFFIISVILCIGVLVFIFWGSSSYDVAITAMILFIPVIILAPVLLIALIVLFISALTSSSEEKDKETETEIEEKARQIERKIGEGK